MKVIFDALKWLHQALSTLNVTLTSKGELEWKGISLESRRPELFFTL